MQKLVKNITLLGVLIILGACSTFSERPCGNICGYRKKLIVKCSEKCFKYIKDHKPEYKKTYKFR